MHKLFAHISRSEPSAPEGLDSLDAFSSESASPVSRSLPSILAAVGALATIAVLYGFVRWTPFSAEAASASITIDSDPRGAEVLAKGVRQGVTPLVVSIPPGEHVFEIIQSGRRKPVVIAARAGSSVVHHVQFDDAADSSPPVPSATAGASPASGHESGPAAGWLAVRSRVPLEVMDGGQIVGTSAAARIMLPAGRRDLRFVNKEHGFAERRTVQIPVGGTASVAVQVQRPHAEQSSPRMAALSTSGRDKVLPDVVKSTYAEAKAAHEAMRHAVAASGFARVIELIDSLPEDEQAPLADLRVLANDYRDLNLARAEPAPPSEAPERPAPEQATTAAPRAPGAFVPPVPINERLPVWAPNDAQTRLSTFEGLLRLDIGEDGRVRGAEMVRPSHPAYDVAILQAAKNWVYRPATQAGQPIASRKEIRIRLVPR
jgi:TonB family protein